MPKSKEFFSSLKENGKINHPKFDELIEKVPDFEIDTEAHKAFEDSFMTPVRAASHPDVIRTVRYQALMPINRDFDKIISVIAEYDKTTAERLESLKREVGGEKEGDTYRRMEMLSGSLGELFKKIKVAPAGGDEELKKELKKKDATIQEWADKVTDAEKKYQAELLKEKNQFEIKLHDFKLDSELEKLSGTFTFAEAYDKVRKDLVTPLLSSLKTSHNLKLDTKDGQTVIRVLDERGEPRFDGNKQVTINQLLEEKVKPFLKQSNADGTPPPPSQSSQQQFTINGNQIPKGKGVSTVVK